MENKVSISKSGLAIKDDEKLGLLIFSKFSGQFFVCHNSQKENVLNWLNGEDNVEIPSDIIKALGPGWLIPRKEAVYPSKHYIPDGSQWGVPYPSSPIVINWLLTGKCINQCKYCYANDLMHGLSSEPGPDDIDKILDTILTYNPLSVVLTGGEPLLSPFLNLVIKKLHNRAGIIVDTSGANIDSHQAEFFKKYGVFIRISIDSEIPKVNDKIRVTKDRKLSVQKMLSSRIALNAIRELLEADVPIGIQTVATKHNRNDLQEFGIKLDRLGVYSWRILVVSKTKSNSEVYSQLSGDLRGQKRYLKLIPRVKKYQYSNGMAVQITHSYAANSVVLVSPEGTFLTESVISPGKIELDLKHPKEPRIDKIFEKVDIHAHLERYMCDELRTI